MYSMFRRLGFALVFPCVFAASPVLAQTATAPAPEAKAADAAALPAAQSIIDRHIEAIGGRAALKARTSSHTVGTITIPANGMSGTVEVFAARPNKMVNKTSIAGIGEIMEGFDGTHAWSINPMLGPSLAQGDELAQRAFDSDFDSALNGAARYTAMKTLEKTKFDGRDCYKVSLTRKDGGEDIDFYDAATGLKAGSINSRKSPMGVITATSTLSDYKKFGDILQPAKITISVQGVDMVTTFSSIEYDKVHPAVFELPAQIKALIK